MNLLSPIKRKKKLKKEKEKEKGKQTNKEMIMLIRRMLGDSGGEACVDHYTSKYMFF